MKEREKQDTLAAIMEGMNIQWQKERAKTQATLGEFIEKLSGMPPEKEIDGLGVPHSYRGYYCDLAFEGVDGKKTVADTLEMLRGCLGKKFTGYKGGDFWMTERTPIWGADHGCCGDRIVDINADKGSIVLSPDDSF